MRVEHRTFHPTRPSTTRLVHKIDTNEPRRGFVEVVLPNGERLELADSGSTDSIEIRLKPGNGPWQQLSVEPVTGNVIRLRAGKKTPL